MDPLSLAFLGSTAISGIGSLMGASASSKAQEQNMQIAQMNYAQRERERADAMRLAEQARSDSHQGYTDARGNIIRFVEGQGWVTTLTPEDKKLQDAQTGEQFNTINVDEVRRRGQEGRNEQQRLREGSTADALLQEFRDTRRTDPKQLESLIYSKATRGINDAFAARSSKALESSLRQNGGANADKIIAALAGEQSKQQGYAAEDAALSAMKAAPEMDAQKRGSLAQLYSAFGDRASRLPGSTYQPQNVAAGVSGALQGLSGGADAANRTLVGAASSQGGTMPYVQPDMGFANAFASIGGMGANIAGKYLANDQFSNALKKATNSGGEYVNNTYYNS